ncbi:MAG: BglG family transcription antiterminator [Vagococcus sp.]
MKQKEKELIICLLDCKGVYATSQYLASELSLSDRTVRTYIKDLKPILNENGARIHSKIGKGYQLEIVNSMQFDVFLNQQKVKAFNRFSNAAPIEIEDRYSYLLNKLLLEEKVLFVEELSEELYISLSSLNKDIIELRNILKPYSIDLISEFRKGIYVQGTEQHKRHFIMDYFFGDKMLNPFKEYIGNNELFDDISFEELTIIILDEAREGNLKISDIIIKNLVLHLSLAIKRLTSGFELTESDISDEIIPFREYSVAKKIIARIEETLLISFPQQEVYYLTIHLVAKSNTQEAHKDSGLVDEIEEVLNQLSKEVDLPLNEDYQLFNGIVEHMKPMIIRLENKIKLRNPLTDMIMSEYTDIFYLTKKSLCQMKLLKPYFINDDEWAYLTLHIMAGIEKAKNNKKHRVLIICATGYGSAQLLKNRIETEFGQQLIIVDVKGYYEITDGDLSRIDFIISSVDLSSIVFRIPVLHVSVFLKDIDILAIRRQLNLSPLSNEKSINSDFYAQVEEKSMYASNTLKKEYYILYDEKVTKFDVLHALLDVMADNEDKQYKKKMLHQIARREKMGQIIFSDSIVVPHPAEPIGVTTKIGLAIIPNGMKWDEEDNIKFVFLVSPSYIENEGITIVTKAIVRLVSEIDYQKEILKHPTFDHFYDEFIKLL